jgi:transglutaminase-like putative cysteine protease
MSRRLVWDAFTRSIWVKAVALTLVTALVVVTCGREGALYRSVGELNYDSLPTDKPRPTGPAEKLHAVVSELRGLTAIQAKRPLSSQQADQARTARSRIGDEVRALNRQFDADRAKLEKLDAKAALKRLGEIEARTSRIQRALSPALAALPSDGDHAPRLAARAADLLAELSPETPQQPLSSELGFRLDNAEPRSPSLSAGITPAYGAPTASDTPSDLPPTPEQEDLAETPEAKITPAIRDLAEQLDRDPVKIYEYVRNSVRYEPYYGIRKGADQTLAERSGSDADQAALLIAMLRHSGIHARFVQGVAELSAAQAADWLGVNVQSDEQITAAPDILASGGVPTAQIRANGLLTKVRFAHFWVEAHVASDAYRGVEEGIGGKKWLPLDPSIKRTKFVAPRVDVRERLEPVTAEWAEDLAGDLEPAGDSGLITPPQAELDGRVQALVDEQEAILREAGADDDDGLTALVGSRTPLPVAAGYLPASTPFKPVAITDESRALGGNLNASVTFEVSGSDPLSVPNYDPESDSGGGLTFTAPTRDLANKRITVSYVPATEADAEIIDAYHGLLNAPTYAAALIPVLRVDGRVVARGRTAVSTGYTQNFRIVYRSPGFASDVVENPVAVGGLSTVALDLGDKSLAQIRARGNATAALRDGTTTENILTDARGGEMLGIMGELYFARNDQYNAIIGSLTGVHQQRGLSGAIVAMALRTRYVAGFPVSTKLSGVSFDVDQDVTSVTNLTGNADALRAYARASGVNTSLSEGQILELMFKSPAASTTRVLSVATGQGIPIFQVDQSNVDTVVPQLELPESTTRDIRAAVAQGATVVAPQRTVTVGGWHGAGYVIEKGLAADYRISGGASGGFWENISIPGVPTDKGSLGVMAAVFLGLDDRIAACISIALDIWGMWTFSHGLVFVGALMWGTPPMLALATVAFAYFMTIILFVYTTMMLWNDTNKCLTGEGDQG